ncbi:hypothetical protein F4802DRAFT_433389 [Xylaria palmicola]|nr:hypothetical protein F4802DRAFT_433389 [Xylaria palmicola]
MLKEFLDSMTDGVEENEDVAELVVTALGTAGAHYICWKTSLGIYKQRSYGLPAELQEWLFPSDGTTRDFPTLQVVLLSDDAFWASDRNGEIRNDSPLGLKQLRRALTFHDGSSSPTRQRSWSRGREFEPSMDRPRSSTLPATLPGEGTAARRQLRPLFSHSRAPSWDKLRLGPDVPIAVPVRRQGRASPIRPRSIDTSLYGEALEVLKEQPTPRAGGMLPSPFDPERTPMARYKPTYTDAGVQTEAAPIDALVPDKGSRGCRCRREGHNTQRDSAVSFGLSSKPSKSFADSRRSSLDTTITRPDSGFFEGISAPPPPILVNPIAMGRMQDYFRSTHYVLGAALQPQGMG